MDQLNRSSSASDFDEPDRRERTPSSGLLEPLFTAPSSPHKPHLATAPSSRPVSIMMSHPGHIVGQSPAPNSPPSLSQSQTSLYHREILLNQGSASINTPPETYAMSTPPNIKSVLETTFMNPTAPADETGDEEDELQQLLTPEPGHGASSLQTGYCVYRGLLEPHKPSRIPLQHQPRSYTSGANNPDTAVLTESQVGCGRVCGRIMQVISWILIVLTFPFSLCACIKLVQEYERAVIFRLGRIIPGGAKGPGMFFILPCIDQYIKIDLRTMSFDVPPQEILTKDSVTVAVDAVVYYRVFNATISVTNVADADRSTRLLAQTTLRNVLGTKHLSDILVQREEISQRMQETLDIATDPWGIKVERVEIKDVRLPIQLQRAMATEAEAFRDANAKVVTADGERRAAKALKEAADVISESPSALQLRYLQTLGSIATDKNSTIVFPIPIDTINAFMPNRNPFPPYYHSTAPVHYNLSQAPPQTGNQSDPSHHTDGQSHPVTNIQSQSPPHALGQSNISAKLQSTVAHKDTVSPSNACQHCGH